MLKLGLRSKKLKVERCRCIKRIEMLILSLRFEESEFVPTHKIV